MKKFKTALMTLIVSLCLVFGLAFAVACGEKETTGGGSTTDQTQDNDTSVAHYTVTLSFDSSKGTVTKSDAASADGYVKDETVTITVTPKEGVVVDSVKAGDATLTPDADGKYSFKIVGDVTVSVTFKDAAVVVTHYTVSLSFDSEKGSATKSDPASADGYVKDETVTITVTPEEGFAVDFVKAGDVALEPNADGTYSFKVSGNITVSVTFKSVEVTPSGTALVLDAKYHGTYHEIDGSASVADLVVSATGVKWGDKDVLLASPFEDGDLYYNVLVDGEAYELHINDADHTIWLNTSDYSVEITFLKENETISFTVSVSVTNREGGTAAVTPVKPQYSQDDEVTLTVTPNEGYEIDTVTMDGEVVPLENGVYTFNVTRNVTFVVTFKEIVVSENALILDEEFFGTYHDMNTENPSDDLVISARGVFWGDDEVLVVEYEQSTGEYTVTVGDSTTEYFFKANEEGTISLFTGNFSVEKTFLKEGVTLSFTVTVNVVGDETQGTATLTPEKEKYEQDESVTLTVTPAQGYLVDRVSVDYEDVSLENGTTYTFPVTKNTEIYVSFKKDVIIPTEFQGVWTNIADDSDTFTLDDKTMTWTGHDVEIELSDGADIGIDGICLTLYIDGDDIYGTQVMLFSNTNAVYLSWSDPVNFDYYEGYYIHGEGTTIPATTISAGSFTQVSGTKKLTISDTGAVSIDDTALKLYFTGDLYLAVIDDDACRINLENANYITIESLDSEAADPVSEQYVREDIHITPHKLYVGDWTGENEEKLTISEDGTATLTGVDGVTSIQILECSLRGMSLLVTASDGVFLASVSVLFEGEAMSITLQTSSDPFTGTSVVLSRAVDKLTLADDWQSGYVYEGENFPDFEKFVVDETGLYVVDDYNNKLEDYYAYAFKISDTEYVVFNLSPYDSVFVMTLNDDTITFTDTMTEAEYTYTKAELAPIPVFNVTLQYENGQGSVTLADNYDDDYDGVYVVEKPEEGKTLTLTIIVTARGGYTVKSVKVGEEELTDEEGNGRYTYTTDGSEDITVVVEFEEKELDPIVLDSSWQGTYSCEDTENDLVIDENGGVKWGDSVVYLVETYTETSCSVMINGETWTLDTSEINNETPALGLMGAMEYYYFTKNGGSTAPTSFSVSVTCDVDEGTYATTMGTAEVDKETCEAGGTVTLTVTPGEGYEIATVTVDGDTVTVTEGANGVFTFTIEEVTADVVIVVTFKASTTQDAPAA